MWQNVAVAALALATVGCEYGPGHLDALYAQRDLWQRHIDGVEARHGLESRDAAKREAECGILQAREEAYRSWLATLTPEQRFEWMLRQEELDVERDRTATGERMHQAEMRAVERERLRKIWVGDQQRIDVHHHRGY
jgi:hypothetical protein